MIDPDIPESWGPACWRTMHTMAAGFPLDNPSDIVALSFVAHFESMRSTLPCEVCRSHFAEYLDKNPVAEHVASREAICRWTMRLHNSVNERLRKPERWDFERFKSEYYSKGPRAPVEQKKSGTVREENSMGRNPQNLIKPSAVTIDKSLGLSTVASRRSLYGNKQGPALSTLQPSRGSRRRMAGPGTVQFVPLEPTTKITRKMVSPDPGSGVPDAPRMLPRGMAGAPIPRSQAPRRAPMARGNTGYPFAVPKKSGCGCNKK